MKRILIALAALWALSAPALAASCTNPVAVLNGAGTSMSFNTTVDGSNNCTSNTFPGAVLTTLTAWNTSTALNATQTLMSANAGAPAIIVQLNQIAAITAGAVTFEGTYDGTNWVTIPVAQVLNPNTFANLTNPYTLVVSTNQPFLILTQGYQSVRIKLSTAITASSGAGTVTPFVTLLSTTPALAAMLNPTGISVGGIAVSGAAPFPVQPASQYPIGATAITASATGTTGATTATLAGTSGKTTYICSMSIRSNATAAATGAATVTGTITGTLTYQHWTAPNASGMGITEMIYTPCVPASATNTGIAVVSPAPGTGGVVSSNATGYQL